MAKVILENSEERAQRAFAYLESLGKRGYSLTIRYVDGRHFIYAKSTLEKYKDISCMSKNLIECIEQMQIDEKEARA